MARQGREFFLVKVLAAGLLWCVCTELCSVTQVVAQSASRPSATPGATSPPSVSPTPARGNAQNISRNSSAVVMATSNAGGVPSPAPAPVTTSTSMYGPSTTGTRPPMSGPTTALEPNSGKDVYCSDTGESQCSAERLPSVFKSPNVCQYDVEAQDGGALIAGMFDLHSVFNGKSYSCPDRSFRGWDAVISTQAFLYSHRLALTNLTRLYPAAVSYIENLFNTSLDNLMGVRIRDTCSSSLLSTVHAINLTADAVEDTTVAATCTPRVQLMIGPAGSQQVASISNVLSSKSIPQITYWASSAQFDDTQQYPYLFRTVPSDVHQVDAIADIIEHFGWTYIGLVASVDTVYGQSGLEGLRTESEVRNTFCIGQEHSVSRLYLKHIVTVIKQLKQDSQIRAIVIFALLEDARVVLQTMISAGYTDVVVVGSEDWVNRLDFNNDFRFPRSNATAGTRKFPSIFGFAPRPVQSHYLEQVADNLKSIFQDANLLKPYWQTNPWLKIYLEESLDCSLSGNSSEFCQGSRRSDPQSACTDSDVFIQSVPSLLPTQPLIQAVFLAMSVLYSSLSAAAQFYTPVAWAKLTNCIQTGGVETRCLLSNLAVPCDDVVHLVPEAYKSTTQDSDGRETTACLLFDPCTQSALPFYHVLNLQLQSDGLYNMQKVGDWSGFSNTSASRLVMNTSSSIDWTVTGELVPVTNNAFYPISTCHSTCGPGLHRVYDEVLTCCWTCVPCPNVTISNRTNEDRCYPCAPGTEPNTDQSQCVDIPGTYVGLTSVQGTVIIVEAAIGIAVFVFTLVMIWVHRAKPQIKACDVHLSTVMLVSGLLAFISAIVALRHPSDAQCRLILLFSTPWTLICSATILAKTNRLHRLFTASQLVQLKLLSTPVQLTLIFLLGLLGEIIALLAVFISEPDVERLLVNGNSVELVCRSSKFTPWYGSIVGYNILLIAVCLVLAFRVRKLPERYNEARLIFMAAFCTFMVWLALGPAFFITTGALQPFIISLSSSAQIWSMWACLFAPRLYQVLSPKEQKKVRRMSRNGTLSSTFEHSSKKASKEYGQTAEQIRRAHKLGELGRSSTISTEVEYACGLEDYTPATTPKISTVSNPGELQFLPEHQQLQNAREESTSSTDSDVPLQNGNYCPSPSSEIINI